MDQRPSSVPLGGLDYNNSRKGRILRPAVIACLIDRKADAQPGQGSPC